MQFGSDASTELLLYIRGKTLAGEDGQHLVITSADLEIHFQSGMNSITRCFSPRDELKLESIACERDIRGLPPVQIFLENHDDQQWSGSISWRRHSVPITFTRPRIPAEIGPQNQLVGDWRSSDPKCLGNEVFHIRTSETGAYIVTYDRIEQQGMTIGEPWDVGAYKGDREIIERTDGAMGGSRIFVPQLSPDGSKLSGYWIGHNPLGGCTEFTREASSNASSGS
jgi:hypothetical protein